LRGFGVLGFGTNDPFSMPPAFVNKLLSIGDALDAFMAIMVLRTCQQVEGGLPVEVTSKMWFNIILDFGIADAVFRANTL
jgi:Domain of unknown function (DUF4112)